VRHFVKKNVKYNIILFSPAARRVLKKIDYAIISCLQNATVQSQPTTSDIRATITSFPAASTMIHTAADTTSAVTSEAGGTPDWSTPLVNVTSSLMMTSSGSEWAWSSRTAAGMDVEFNVTTPATSAAATSTDRSLVDSSTSVRLIHWSQSYWPQKP